jgi:hypothetical protein
LHCKVYTERAVLRVAAFGDAARPSERSFYSANLPHGIGKTDVATTPAWIAVQRSTRAKMSAERTVVFFDWSVLHSCRHHRR